MKNDIIAFKGINDGVYLEINGSDFNQILEEIDKKIKESPSFFKGVKFRGIKGKNLSDSDILEINLILKYKYDLNITLDQILETIKELDLIEDKKPEELITKELYTIDSKFVHRTLRSGQAIEHDGNIVVIGDVNPGAFLRSTGSIIVLGALKGVAHAGSNGNMDSIVAAYNLLPNQLRIGNLIVRAPDNYVPEYQSPEVARVYKNKVIIEPYLPNK